MALKIDDKINISEYELKTTMKFDIEPLLEIKEGANTRIIMSRGNISTSTGQAKARKTFAVTLFTSSLLESGLTYNKFISRGKYLVIYVLTEESKAHSIMVGKRIETIKNRDSQPENFRFFNVRKCSPSQRVDIITEICYSLKPDILIIDGVKDLVNDVNNIEQASAIETLLLKITDELNNHIHCVIHQNPGSDKMRGHLGTSLMQKSETVIVISKDIEQKQYSIIKPSETRNEDFTEFAFLIENGIPVLTDYKPMKKEKRSKKDEQNDDCPY
jgi:hypothetical protein